MMMKGCFLHLHDEGGRVAAILFLKFLYGVVVWSYERTTTTLNTNRPP